MSKAILIAPLTPQNPPINGAMEKSVAEELDHWKTLDRKRKHRSFALFTKVSPLIQAGNVLNSLQALSSAAPHELYSSGWDTSGDVPNIDEGHDEPARNEPCGDEAEREDPDHEELACDRPDRGELNQTPNPMAFPPGSWTFPEPQESFPGVKGGHADELPAEDPDLRQAMLGVAILHLFLILGTVILVACVALHGSRDSAISTLVAVVGIILIVFATLRVNRYCLTAALYLMLAERRR